MTHPPDVLLLRALAVALGLTAALATPAVSAQAFDAVRLFGIAPGSEAGLVGLGVIHGRAYAGADETRWLVRPLIDYQWSNGWFAGTSNGIGYNFSRQRGVDYGVRLTADFGRSEDRSPRLRGVGDIDPAAEVGAFFNYGVARSVVLTSSVRYGAGNDNRGVVLDLGAVYSTRLGDAWRLGTGIATTWVNAEYMQDYFGVSAAQAARSGYAVYQADAGVRDMRASASLSYALSPRASVTTVVGASRLLGNAADSPFVVKKTSVTGVLALGYAF